jgi:hypothetical protein
MNRTLLSALLLLATIPARQAFAQTDNALALNAYTYPSYPSDEDPDRQAPLFVKKCQFQAGVFVPFNNTNVRAGSGEYNIATDVNLEKDLGFKTHNFSALFGFQWRISRRSRLDLNYFYLGRSATTTIEKTIHFDNYTYPVEAQVNAHFNASIGLISYGYAILSKPTYEAGLMIGTHVMNADMGISLNTGTATGTYNAKYNITAPLPDVGAFGGYAITDKLAVNAEIRYLSMTIDKVYGSVLDYNVCLQYKIYQGLGISLSYTGFNFKVDDNDYSTIHLNGFVKWNYQGPALTVTYTFGRGF